MTISIPEKMALIEELNKCSANAARVYFDLRTAAFYAACADAIHDGMLVNREQQMKLAQAVDARNAAMAALGEERAKLARIRQHGGDIAALLDEPLREVDRPCDCEEGDYD